MTASTHDDLLTDLTDAQRTAVLHTEGPLLVLAGAGSGKTRVITRRVANLVLRVGIAPWNVLAITFTNKAAGEMRERVAHLVSARQAQAITVCTFHSLCARLIRQYAPLLKLSPSFSIYDTADQQRVVKQVLEHLQISTSNFPPSRVLHAISNAKNELLDADAFEKTAHDFFSRNIARVYRRYQEALVKNNALDFDDLLLRAVDLLRHHPDVTAELRQRYQYLLIDEYQDTNHAQFVIAHSLAAGHQNLCATGDPDQSIYGWRGADIRNILEFEQHYPSATVVRLEQNYRSTQRILAVADGLIKNNKRRKHKSLWTENQAGDPVRLVTCYDERQEAHWLVERFTALHDQENIAWSGMAVFYRVNSLSRVVEDALRTAAIPYQIARGTAFYERKEVKDAVAYLRVVANPADEVNLLRIINTPARGISDSTLKFMQAHAIREHRVLVDVLETPSEVTSLNSRAVNAVQRFTSLFNSWRRLLGDVERSTPSPSQGDPRKGRGEGPADEYSGLVPQTESSDLVPPDPHPNPSGGLPERERGPELTSGGEISLRAFVERILRESGLENAYRNDKSDPDQDRLLNLGELVSSAQQFEDEYDPQATLVNKLRAFLEQIALVSDVDSLAEGEGAVTLMTLHAAKGLEFPVVAMVGVEDGLLPHMRAQDEDHDVEEERRLCFVGITRTQRMLMMTHARFRTVFGITQPTIPSRFLAELPKDAVELLDISRDAPGDAGLPTSNLAGPSRGAGHEPASAAAPDQYPPGSYVRHPQFGLGRVLSTSNSGDQARAKVQFTTAGVKNLILEYARLEKVSRDEVDGT